MNDPDLGGILDAVRAYSLARWGVPAKHVQFQLWDGRTQQEIVPTLPARNDAGKPVTEPWASADFRRVRWPGLNELRFSAKQAAVVKLLWDAADGDEPACDQAELLRAAGSDGDRLRDLFRRHPAWDALIVGAGDGRYRLASLGDEDDATE